MVVATLTDRTSRFSRVLPLKKERSQLHATSDIKIVRLEVINT